MVEKAFISPSSFDFRATLPGKLIALGSSALSINILRKNVVDTPAIL